MTKKDYELLASCFEWDINFLRRGAEFKPGGDWVAQLRAVKAIASYMATKLEVENPKFDRKRFLEACGIAD